MEALPLGACPETGVSLQGSICDQYHSSQFLINSWTR